VDPSLLIPLPPVAIPAQVGRGQLALNIPATPSVLGIELVSQAVIIDGGTMRARLTGWTADAIVK
jgi:hypothetical protein